MRLALPVPWPTAHMSSAAVPSSALPSIDGTCDQTLPSQWSQPRLPRAQTLSGATAVSAVTLPTLGPLTAVKLVPFQCDKIVEPVLGTVSELTQTSVGLVPATLSTC